MDANNFDPRGRPNLPMRFAIWIAGADEETLQRCPRHDWDCVAITAILMILVWMYQVCVFSLAGHRILMDDGMLHPLLIAASGFLATMVLVIDSFMVMRSFWHLHGIDELKRGGMDITGGSHLQFKNAVFLSIRMLLTLSTAQLTALSVALSLFHTAIIAQVQRTNRQENAAIIATAAAAQDQAIKQAQDAVVEQNKRVTTLQTELGKLRQGAVDAGAEDPAIQAAVAEVNRLSAEKVQLDQQLLDAQTFQANELGGIKGQPGNTGAAGKGPAYQGATARVQATTADNNAVSRELSAAQSRLDTLRQQLSTQGADQTKQAKAELPTVEAELQTETAQLATLRRNLANLTSNREADVRKAVERAPGYVRYDDGILGQIRALWQIAKAPEILYVTLLIDFSSFTLELAAVLAKVTSFIPTNYSALLASNAYRSASRIARKLDRDLRDDDDEDDGENDDKKEDKKDDKEDDEKDDDDDPEGDENGSPSGGASAGYPPVIIGPGGGDDDPPQPSKRPRGRPRKNPLG